MPDLSKSDLLLLIFTISALAGPALGDVIRRRDVDDGDSAAPSQATDEADSKATEAPGDCKEVAYPCTRVYSVQKPVKQCISYLCVTSVRRVYMLNKEICKRVMCKEDEIIQDEKCRLLAGLPPRRFPPPDTSEGSPTPEPETK